jgi:diadenosine tetraphosphate (Ap4A) HIT family hydrolase
MDKLNDCVFCDINQDRIIRSTSRIFSVYDLYPVSKGHALVVSKRHIPYLFSATKEEVSEIFAEIGKLRNEIENLYHPNGYNIGINCGVAAGQTVGHLHVHLIPRYIGDVADPRGGVRNILPNGNYLALNE